MEFGLLQGNSEILGKTQGNSVEFSVVCMALNLNSVEIPGGFRVNAGFRENWGFGVVSGDLGHQKAFAEIADLNLSLNLFSPFSDILLPPWPDLRLGSEPLLAESGLRYIYVKRSKQTRELLSRFCQ